MEHKSTKYLVLKLFQSNKHLRGIFKKLKSTYSGVSIQSKLPLNTAFLWLFWG